MDPKHHHGKDRKARCSFEQLLLVEFDAIFSVDVEIDNDSIVVTCANEPGFNEVDE